MKRLALVVLALALVAAACGDDENTFLTTTAPPTTGGETSSTSSPPTTPPTTVPATSTTAPTTSTSATTAPPDLYVVNTSDFFPDPFPGSGDAHGSGCVTPGFDALPDGVWFGFAEGIGGGALTFDLACFFTGPPACAAQIADGFASDPSECIDFWIRNNVATTFSVPIASDARVWYVNMTDPDVSTPTEIPLASWPHPDSFQDCPSDHCSVWLYVNGGEATAIVEQYLP